MQGTIVDDKLFTRARTEYEKYIIDDMRNPGFVPVLGVGPYFSTELNEDGHYDFIITAYGTFVGERKAWRIEGIEPETGTLYPRYIRPSKLKPPSTPAE
jgi:hypothetical protein